jgi:hypothetical protein
MSASIHALSSHAPPSLRSIGTHRARRDGPQAATERSFLPHNEITTPAEKLFSPLCHPSALSSVRDGARAPVHPRWGQKGPHSPPPATTARIGPETPTPTRRRHMRVVGPHACCCFDSLREGGSIRTEFTCSPPWNFHLHALLLAMASLTRTL